MTAVRTRLASYIDRAISVMARWVRGQELHPNQAQLCVIPISREDGLHTTRTRTN